jgi:hypothetical protein
VRGLEQRLDAFLLLANGKLVLDYRERDRWVWTVLRVGIWHPAIVPCGWNSTGWKLYGSISKRKTLLAWILHINKYNRVHNHSKFIITIVRYRRNAPAASAFYIQIKIRRLSTIIELHARGQCGWKMGYISEILRRYFRQSTISNVLSSIPRG